MIHNLESNTTYAIHLRCPSPSGGSKDWIGAVTSNGEIHAYWGKTGTINQHAPKPGNMTSLTKIINEKRAKGYQEVDEYRMGQGWDSQRQQTPPPSKPSPQQPAPKAAPMPKASCNWDKLKAPEAAIEWDF